MPDQQLSLTFSSANATAKHAAILASKLTAGDVILLSGDVGSGKTHFARSLIQSILPSPQDVPSPTFTLVQTYDTLKGEVWHADLYRLTSTHEIEELGLVDAFDDAICLIEWPDRLGDLAPTGALHLTLAPGKDEDMRHATLSWSDPKWKDRLSHWQTT